MRISDWSSDVCSSDLRIDAQSDAESFRFDGFSHRLHLELLERLQLGLDPLDAHLLPAVQAEAQPALALFELQRQDSHPDQIAAEIGRASCRERVCQYV